MQFDKQGASSHAQPMPAPATAVPVTVKSADTSVRLAFLRKVYTLLTINFLITIGVSCAFSFIIPIRDYIVDHQYLILVGLAVALGTLLVLACVPLKFPVNLIVMYIFVLAFSFVIGTICARYYERGYGIIVLQAFLATAAVFLTITAYVFITKKDFSFLYGFLGAGLIVLIVISLFTFLFAWGTGRINKWVIFGISVFGYVDDEVRSV